MRVLQIGKYFPPCRGGIESHLLELCKGLSEKTEVEAIAFSNGPTATTNEFDFSLHRVHVNAVIAGAPLALGLVRVIRSIPADVVHLHHPNPMGFLAYVLSRHPGRLIITYHCDIVRQRCLGKLIQPLLKVAFQRAYRILATSEAYAASSPLLQQFSGKVQIVPLGITINPLHSDSADHVTKKIYSDDPLLLSVGRLVHYKGFSVLLHAAALLIARGVKFKLLIVGSGPEEKTLREIVLKEGLQDAVELLGDMDDIKPYFHMAKVFVLPSINRTEAFAIAQLEAMACAVPVINTRLETGVPFVSLDGVTGLTVEPNNPVQLANAIQCLLSDSSLRLRLGKAARLRVTTQFSAGSMVEKIEHIYKQALLPNAEQKKLFVSECRE